MTTTPELEEWAAKQSANAQGAIARIPPLGVYKFANDRDPENTYFRPVSYDDEGRVSFIRFDRTSLLPTWGIFYVDPGDMALIGEVDSQTGMVRFYGSSTGGSGTGDGH